MSKLPVSLPLNAILPLMPGKAAEAEPAPNTRSAATNKTPTAEEFIAEVRRRTRRHGA
jgi:hypothetical protein